VLVSGSAEAPNSQGILSNYSSIVKKANEVKALVYIVICKQDFITEE